MNRFDLVVAVTALTLSTLIVLTIWRGDQVGVQVLEISPAAQAENVSTAADISVRFDQPVTVLDDSTVLTIVPHVDTEIRAERDRLVFDPRPGFAPSTAYTITLLPGIRGEGSRELLAPVSWRFSTASLQIVFAQIDENGTQQLATIPFKLNPAGELIPAQPTSLSNAPGGIYDFGVNPQTGDVIYSALTVTGTADLEIIGADGRAPTRVASCPQAACINPAFSHNGELLAYVRRNASEFSAAIMSPPRLWMKHLASGEESAVFREGQRLGFAPGWSADGKWLSYFTPDRGGVGLYNIEDGREAFYPTRTGDPAAWHSTELRFAMTEMIEAENGAETRLTAIDPLTDQRTGLTLSEHPVEDDAPVWSPNGKWIAFQRKELAGPRASLGKQIWLARTDGTEARPLTAAPEHEHGPPDWSPNGRYVVYHKFPLSGPNVVLSVWVTDTETGRAWEVVAAGQRPRWLP